MMSEKKLSYINKAEDTVAQKSREPSPHQGYISNVLCRATFWLCCNTCHKVEDRGIGPPVRHPERGWTILIGSGIKEQGGTILVYRSWELAKGWKLAGELCCGKKEDGTGIVW
eukprot:scaffold214451_cov16-Tisochrysis_lutea.AAC.1